jgi:wyosine [tRNA(Phe)-imidazoG37] synthetase (radical SAM superfamily)
MFSQEVGEYFMNLVIEKAVGKQDSTTVGRCLGWQSAYGYARNFLDNRFVYVVVSPRARGLSIGVNLNPDKQCNFDCPYCEVNREAPAQDLVLDVETMAAELDRTLRLVEDGRLRELPLYSQVPAELLKLRHVALSGDGEPTLCPRFAEAVQAVIHVRAVGQSPFFKIVLITNASGLGLPEIQGGLQFLTSMDEIWAKLDAGTQAYMDKVNKAQLPLENILANILAIGRRRPIIIQSLFPSLKGQPPPEAEIEQYVLRLKELKEASAQISLVQIYSATRPTPHSECGHLPLKTLSRIAQRVREGAGLKAEVF